MSAGKHRLSRREALEIIAVGMSLPFIPGRKNGVFAEDSQDRVSVKSLGTDGCQATFVNDYAPGPDSRVELKNARFVDALNARFFEAGTSIFIEKGKIVAICGPSNPQCGITPDFSIDLAGKTVLPTLFNTHCHIGNAFPTFSLSFREMALTWRYGERQIARNMAECLAHGITNIRDTGITDLRISQQLKEDISRGKMRGPRILQSIVVGPPSGYMTENVGLIERPFRRLLRMPHVDYGNPNSGALVFPVNASEQEVRDAVNRAVDERGAECIKVGEQLENVYTLKPDATIMTREQLTAIADQARKKDVKSTIHHVSVATFRRAVECGISSLAHAAIDELLTKSDVEVFKKAGCFIEPTVSVAYDECWKIKGEPLSAHPEMERLDRFRAETLLKLAEEYWMPELGKSVRDFYQKYAEGKVEELPSSRINMFKYYARIVSNGGDNVRLLIDMGASVAAGNDGGVPPCTPAMMGHEISMLDFVMRKEPDKKLPGADAVRIATINSAQALGLENKFGSIETGKVADLAIVDGNPFDDIRVIGSPVAALFMDGRLVINNCGLEVMPA